VKAAAQRLYAHPPFAPPAAYAREFMPCSGIEQRAEAQHKSRSSAASANVATRQVKKVDSLNELTRPASTHGQPEMPRERAEKIEPRWHERRSAEAYRLEVCQMLCYQRSGGEQQEVAAASRRTSND